MEILKEPMLVRELVLERVILSVLKKGLTRELLMGNKRESMLG